MRIAIIGTGYVGLVTGACLADFGNDVVQVELDGARLARLEAGELPIYEPGLEPVIASNRAAGRYRFTGELEAAVRDAEVVYIAMRVNVKPSGEPQVGEILEVGDRIGKVIGSGDAGDYKVIAARTTVPIGTVDRLRVRIGVHASVPFGVVSNPSFLKEGNAVEDFMKPDRIVIGTSDVRAAEILRRVYSPLLRARDCIFVTDSRSAELAKYATSALLATRVSFMNDLAMLAEEVGADIETIRKVMGADPRIGHKYLFVGPGFGGRLLQNDIGSLLHAAREAGRDLAIVRATHEINVRQKRVLAEKLERALQGSLDAKRIGIWGVSFKPKSADLGEAPALTLIDLLLEKGAKPVVHDPRALDN
ncbi:MAG: UDP-glucose/GDP-mannose dehydrogenase family protein, partial [Myxococcales bacterium]|nr:UDP-glucose/GDP-mannose dehydrogenase family protein [Myxococcales bacterium]